jgi:phosphoglycolate phosphatase-like HAD superfamily hydrolase
MQPRPWPQVPELTAAVAQAAFPKGCLAMRVRDELGVLFADEEFASAFGRRYRTGATPEMGTSTYLLGEIFVAIS